MNKSCPMGPMQPDSGRYKETVCHVFQQGEGYKNSGEKYSSHKCFQDDSVIKREREKKSFETTML